MNRLETLPSSQVDYTLKYIVRSAYVIWPAVVCMVALSRYNESPALMQFSWFLLAFLLPVFLHTYSRKSETPIKVLKRELIFASFIQGVLIAFVNLQVLPTFTILTTLSGLAFVGGAGLLVMGLAACLLGVVFTAYIHGIDVTVSANFDLNVLSLFMFFAIQLQFVLFALKYFEKQEKQNNLSSRYKSIDAKTGLNNAQYFEHLVKTKQLSFLNRDKANQHEAISIVLYLIQIENLERLCLDNPQESKDRLMVDLAYTLLGKSKTNDLVLRWNKDTFLLLTELGSVEKMNLQIHDLKSNMNLLSVDGKKVKVSLESSYFDIDTSQSDMDFWHHKIQSCQP